MRKLTYIVAAALIAVSSSATAQATYGPLSPAPRLGEGKDAQGRPLPFGVPAYFSPDTPLGSGAFPALMETADSLPEHVIYRPADLSEAGQLPVIVFGNGGCIHAGNRFRGFLTEIASHGYLIIAAGPVGHVSLEVGPQENPAVRRPGEAAPPAAPPPADDPSAPWRSQRSTAQHLIEGIDWAVAENSRQGSPFFGRLDTAHIAAAGQSCGGFLATEVAADPRVTTLVNFNSGTTVPQDASSAQGQEARRRLQAIHTPALYILGERDQEILFDAGAQSFAALNDTPVFYAWEEGLQHIGTYGAPQGGAIGRIGLAWFDWQLKGDAVASRMFVGPDCTLCREPTWHVQKKKID